MIGAAIALAGFAVVAYGYVQSSALTMLAGFLAMLIALGLEALPIVRRVEEPEPVDAGELLDFSDIDWSDFHRTRIPSDQERAA